MSKKRGRPKKANAKRRQTTRTGRRTGFDPVDYGTDQLRLKRLTVTGTDRLSHEEPLAALYGRALLTTAEYNAGRDIADLLATISPLHVGSVWQRLLSGPAASPFDNSPTPAAERAYNLLSRLALVIGEAAPLLFALCGGQWVVIPLATVTQGLDRVSRRWSNNRAEAA